MFMSEVVHLSNFSDFPICGTDSFFRQVMLTKRLRLATCKACLSIMRSRIKPTTFDKWTDETWDAFMGSPSETTNQKEK
jgi:hypothetical protein